MNRFIKQTSKIETLTSTFVESQSSEQLQYRTTETSEQTQYRTGDSTTTVVYSTSVPIFSIEGVDQPLHVIRVIGREAISELYEFHVTVSCTGEPLEIGAILGSATQFMLPEANVPRVLHGIVSRCGEGDAINGATLYDVTLVPRAWLLVHRRDCRIFQGKTTPEIIETVLESAGFSKRSDYRLALVGNYAPRDYCVQYRESDWAFIRRLMVEEGIFCYFEVGDAADVLVLGDWPGSFLEIGAPTELVYRPSLEVQRGSVNIHRFRYSEQIRPGKVSLRDYDFKRPSKMLDNTASEKHWQDLEQYDYPGSYELQKTGDHYAQIRLEQLRAARQIAQGASGCARLAAGYRFSLVEHTREGLNRAYLLTSVEHDAVGALPGDGGGKEPRYENRFTCIPADVPFRPEPRDQKPTIKGLQSAVVVGPSKQEIHTDEFGRVKVQFHWDRAGKSDDTSSCWLRVAQVWAGTGFGGMLLPRVGHEVLVDFLDGDPDRPIVVGGVYNAENPPPYPLPAGKTKSTLKSSSTPGGDGYNELRFEDEKGNEELHLHAQKNLVIAVKNDESRTVHHNQGTIVGNDRSAQIINNDNVNVEKDRTVEIGQDETLTVIRNRTRIVGQDEKVEVKNDRFVTIGNNLQLNVIKDRKTTIGVDDETSVTGNYVLSVGGYQIQSTTEGTGNATTWITGNDVLNVGGNQKATIEGNRFIAVEGNQRNDIDGNADLSVGGNWTVYSSGACTITSEYVAVLAAPAVVLSGDFQIALCVGECSLTISPDALNLSVGESSIEIKTDGIAISSSGEVTINGSKIKLN